MTSSIRLAITLVVLGLILLITSVLWPHLVADDRVWTADQAREHAQASSKLHMMIHEAAESQLDTAKNDAERKRVDAELKAAQERFKNSRAALNRAQRTRSTASTVMRWTGIAMLLAGVGHYMSLRSGAHN